MKEYKRYYCMMTVDFELNKENPPQKSLEELEEAIEGVLEKWACKMQEKGLSAGIGWNWSEHINMRG